MALADPGASSISVTGMTSFQAGKPEANNRQSVSGLSQFEKLRNCKSSCPERQQHTDDTGPNVMTAHSFSAMAPLLVCQRQSLGRREFGQ
jgi:hypothetical protein